MGIVVFDLDQTIIDSRHRTPVKDGKVDVVKYISLQTRDNIYRDTILPLADVMKKDYKDNYIIICTARHMTKNDYDFLRDNDLKYHEIYERGIVDKSISSLDDAEYKMKCLKKYKHINYTFYDDSEEVINKFKMYPNVRMVDSKIENVNLLQIEAQ
tara:strand:- start:1210 stop:1677 length:468 start_codon:yes stop_codon:yes gene_type:complete